MIDSHAHVYLSDFKKDISDVLDRCQGEGVSKILLPNIDHTSIDDMLELENRDPVQYPAMIGLHPCSVKKGFEKELYLIENWLSKRKFIAIGEMGTDLYWDKTYWPQQQEAFKIQCDLALKYELPIVIHSRESINETIELVEPFAKKGLKGVFHCFTGTANQAEQIKNLGFYLGIGGVVTFKNSGLDKVMKDIGPEKLLLETDSPYLAPVPWRGKRNEPAHLALVRNKLSDIFDLSIEEIESITENNTVDLFSLNGI